MVGAFYVKESLHLRTTYHFIYELELVQSSLDAHTFLDNCVCCMCTYKYLLLCKTNSNLYTSLWFVIKSEASLSMLFFVYNYVYPWNDAKEKPICV